MTLWNDYQKVVAQLVEALEIHRGLASLLAIKNRYISIIVRQSRRNNLRGRHFQHPEGKRKGEDGWRRVENNCLILFYRKLCIH